MCNVRFRADGTNIFSSRNMLFQETIMLRVSLTFYRPFRHRNALQQDKSKQSEDAISHQPEADTPIITKEQQQNTNNQQEVSQYLKCELGEEVCKRVHISINTFDQFASRVFLVEGHIKQHAE